MNFYYVRSPMIYHTILFNLRKFRDETLECIVETRLKSSTKKVIRYEYLFISFCLSCCCFYIKNLSSEKDTVFGGE